MFTLDLLPQTSLLDRNTFLQSMCIDGTLVEKSVDGVLGIRTRGRRMVGADETTELWRPPLDGTLVSSYDECLRSSRFKLFLKMYQFNYFSLGV